MKLAIAQLNPTIGDLTGNIQQILDAAQQATAQGVRLLLTPELSLCGYPPRDLLMQQAFIKQMEQALKQLAINLPPGLAVLVGIATPNPSAFQTGGKPLFNSSALLEGGAVQQIFHKRLLPTYDVFDEDRYFEPGKSKDPLMLDGVRIGVTICEDLWNDENFWGKRNYAVNPIAELAEIGVDLIVNLSASPYSVGKQKLREAMLRHAAQTYQIPILYANQVGGNDDLIFDGNSVGFDRQGEMVCRGQAFATDLVIVDYDSDHQDLRIHPETIAPQPELEDAEIWQALVLGVGDYVRKCGFAKVVLGLSGGIDSSLVAAIAAAAVGPENVLGILMPSPYSSDHSVKDALELAANLGIQTETLPIGELMTAYDRTFANLFANTEFGIAEENIQSRIRGNLLMAVSNKFGHLLISTGNKSEMAVGYCTLYGDMNGGLAAIADVPKTRVYSICRWLNQGNWEAEVRSRKPEFGDGAVETVQQNVTPLPTPHSPLPTPHSSSLTPLPTPHSSSLTPHPSPLSPQSSVPTPHSSSLTPQSSVLSPQSSVLSPQSPIPPNILAKPPSAELKPGQMDQDSLPSYEVLDDILEQLILEHQSPIEIVASGHDRDIVEKVVKLVNRAEFKRKQAPPGLKVTDRAFGTGWRMPIAKRWQPDCLSSGSS
ncbi:NAD+ synthase [Egbenema bharatensis]|uniref:NAD+ synthase n=1 Tax=Egbenema bharatensis TaxID=3463334 RepID=UPI003A8C49E4